MQTPNFRFFLQFLRIFGAETTILRAFQTLSIIRKLRAPKDLIPDNMRFFIMKLIDKHGIAKTKEAVVFLDGMVVGI